MPFQKGHRPPKRGEKIDSTPTPVEVVQTEAIKPKEEVYHERQAQDDKVTFFTEMDMNAKGQIVASLPTWYNRQLMENIKEEIRRDEASITNGYVPEVSMGEFKEGLNKKKEKLFKIEDALKTIEKRIGKDFVTGLVGKRDSEKGLLGDKIADATPSEYDDNRRLSDAHTQAQRWDTPCISLTDDEKRLVRMSNGRIVDGKTSLVEASIAWKLGRSFLQLDSDTARLRRER